MGGQSFAHLDRAPRPKRMSLVLRRELWAPLTEAAAAIGMGQRFEPLALLLVLEHLGYQPEAQEGDGNQQGGEARRHAQAVVRGGP